ncbi:MAG TPA: C45 family peptidase [Geminicoccaceae bacterium]|nr:C45 family peptidase [Geminicoccaceae bacterium]
MTFQSLTFDAVAEARPGRKWCARWHRSWSAYETWFCVRGGDSGPTRAGCEAALAEHMPELVPVHRQLARLAGDGDRAARFLSTWCPPPYLGGCSLAARADGGTVRLVRNYDLSPDLNEGLLLRTEWTGMPVMGMVEFLWGLSDGVNAAGLSAALAFGGRSEVARGFGVTTILRYVLETCATVGQALAVLARVPSHMAYNITLADRQGATATVELLPGGGARRMPRAIATNHQHGAEAAERPDFTRSEERREHLKELFSDRIAPEALGDIFLEEPLFQRNYAAGFGTLFTAVYDPTARRLTLRWPGHSWSQRLDAFREGRREVRYLDDLRPVVAREPEAPADVTKALEAIRPFLSPARMRAFDRWARGARTYGLDWASFGRVFSG